MNKKISALSMAIAVALASTTASASIATGLSNFKIDHAKTDVYSNSYKVNKELPEVTAYLSNWTHYQQGYVADLDELSKYDTVLLSFFGLCGTKVGDPSVTGGINGLATSCAQFGLKKFELSSTDSYADLEKQFPGMGMSWQPDLTWKSPTPNGLLGVMKKLHEEKGTRVGISIFGWSLSNIASDAVKPENRAVFLNSLIDFVRAYPFIGQLDIDWEYPGIQGAPENVFDPVNDAKNYREFIAELRTELDKMGRNDVVIGIASGAPHDKIDAAKLKDLVEAGVDNIHLMTYDFFGQWDTTLNHHTNLYSSDDSKWSADKAIQYMIQDLGIPSKNIQLGYANYSRNAIVEADIQASPLRGDFRPVHNTAGTFEAAVTSVNDLFENFVTVSQTEKMEGKNGYKLYTDAVSNADFVYNESNKLFVSIDTPRSVFAKAQYVNKHNLGGIFTWMADHDEGLMLNAAREGLGYEVKEQVFNMEQLINSCGVNITSDAECKELTNLFDGNKAPSVSASDKQAQYVKGGVYDLSAQINGSTDVAVKHVTWTLEKSSIGNDNIAITDKGLKSVFTVNHNAVSDHVVATFNVEVTFANNTKSSDTMTYTLKVNETIPEIESISHRNTYKIGSGEELAFTANASDDLDRNLAYSWKVTPKDIAITSDAERVTVLVDTNELPNKPEYNVQAEVTVTNKFGNTDIMSATTTVIGNPDMNAAPTAMFTVKSEVLEAGDIVEMTSISTDELPKELSLNWQVTLNGGNIAVDQSRGHDASFDTDVAGSYSVTLTAIDVFGISSTKTKLIEVSERLTPQECEVKDENADSYPQWNATTIYTTETVGYNGLVYTAKWWTQGNEPTPTAEMWKLESEVELPWSVEAVYHGGDQVDYEGKRWEAKWWTQGSKPSESSDVWFFVGEAICK